MQYSVEKMLIVRQLILSFCRKYLFCGPLHRKKWLSENVCKFMASSKLWIYCLKKLTLNMYCIFGKSNYFEYVFFQQPLRETPYYYRLILEKKQFKTKFDSKVELEVRFVNSIIIVVSK